MDFLIKETEFEKANPAVRIKVTPQMVQHLFAKRDFPVICDKGLEGNYKVIGITQSRHNGAFEFLLATHNAPEGIVFRDFMPEYSRLDAILKTEVSDIMNSVFNIAVHETNTDAELLQNFINAVNKELAR